MYQDVGGPCCAPDHENPLFKSVKILDLIASKKLILCCAFASMLQNRELQKQIEGNQSFIEGALTEGSAAFAMQHSGAL